MSQPEPDLDELQQTEEPTPAVPVRIVEPVVTHTLPARTGPAFVHQLSTAFDQVLSRDLKRRRAVLLLASETATDSWEYSRTGNAGSGVPWPANVPLTLEHCDGVYASGTDGQILTVITEVWAD